MEEEVCDASGELKREIPVDRQIDARWEKKG